MDQHLYHKRHSLAHLLAQAVLRTIDPHAWFGTWPAIEDGCYYDIAFSDGITYSESLNKDLTKTITWLIKENQHFVWYNTKNLDEAHHIIDLMNQPLKHELIKKFAANGESQYSFWANTAPAGLRPRLDTTTKPWYTTKVDAWTARAREKKIISNDQIVVFLDLCEWWHVETTKDIAEWSFVMDKVSGAYRQNNADNQMLTRLYMLAFETKDDLKAYQTMMEEAKKRDHRILGPKLGIFTISDLVGSGLPLFQPNGSIIRQELEKYLWSLHESKWYQRVWTPHLAKEALYECSWHAGHYMDDMFKVKWWSSGEDFYVKPMNCPHHMQIFAATKWSYRDMPVRYFEPATVYRDEKSGQLSGLTRVRAITQDDGHLFCRIDQIETEVALIVSIIKTFFTTMGMIDGYKVRLSVRWDDTSNYLWSDEVRKTSETALQRICDNHNLPYEIGKDEAAFYGPKLDFMFKDAIGRPRQLSTIQLDFNLPERFDLSYTNEQWEKERPVVIHRAISGSLERFMGVMIEHFAGAFPLWLAPTQVIIVPVADAFCDYAYSLKKMMTDAWLRISVDDSDDSFAKKIRNSEISKIPYTIIVGEKEMTDQTVSVRVYKTKEQFVKPVSEFCSLLVHTYHTRALS